MGPKKLKTLCTGLYKSKVHRWFYAQEPTREVSGPITERGGGAGALRNLFTLLRPLPPITKLNRNQETTVRYIICASGA